MRRAQRMAKRLAGVLVDDVQELQDPSVGGLVELVVERPDLIGVLGAQALGRHGRLSEALALAPAGGNSQALLAPEALHSLAIQAPTLLSRRAWARR